MSKYYKAEDVISFLNVYCPKDMWEYQIADLPTIEVSEDAISRADAIECISELPLDEVIIKQALKTLPSVIPQVPNEDAVSREWLEQEIEKFAMSLYKDEEYWKGWNEALEAILAQIELAPSVIPKPKEGEWIYKGNSIEPIWNCSECGKQIICSKSELPNYCEDCGSRNGKHSLE